MHVVQWQMTPHVTQVAEVGQEFPDDRFGPPTVRALEVAVLDEGHVRVRRPADMVAVVIDRIGESTIAGDWPRSARLRSGDGRRSVIWNTNQVSRAATTAAVSTPSVASFNSTPVNATEATSSETVKPIPAKVPPPRAAIQPTGGRSRPLVTLLTRAETVMIPAGLPTT